VNFSEEIKRQLDRDIAESRGYQAVAKEISGGVRWMMTVNGIPTEPLDETYVGDVVEMRVRVYESEQACWEAACPVYSDDERRQWVLYGKTAMPWLRAAIEEGD
jgi:hypothetical protein